MHLPTLERECSQFLKECNGLRLSKNLPKSYEGFKKVKVRQRNLNEVFVQAFNQSFQERNNFLQRSIFANSATSLLDTGPDTEPFYVYPINGYKYVYNPIVTSAFAQYKGDVDYLLEKVSPNAVIEMFASVIRQSYVSDNLAEGIARGAEIIIYNIPYYYAIRKTLIDAAI